ncbi:hypothetical protein BURMUCGD2M_2116 [Burkholderia multivorans CGD2M]|uniref:Uncharacterized protein n=1 Tax=Burkholderia multivorans CGD2 TaxID=513052 RepID=B9BMG0_9BURK|nr:hypothetical protein BURMUCGD2_2030 [Burkholderia multivorans CGD2]EEE14242.1 hypothetical protein BURMUCGD2M_2116 [Burkholderia multivorans CGD2M]
MSDSHAALRESRGTKGNGRNAGGAMRTSRPPEPALTGSGP